MKTATQGEAPNKRSPKRRSRIPPDQQSPYPGGDANIAAPATAPDDQLDISANAIRGPPRLWDRATTLEFFGGIDVSTLYRGIHTGRYPRPVNVSNNVVRWLAHECEAALDRMIVERAAPKPPPRRGRPRRHPITDDANV